MNDKEVLLEMYNKYSEQVPALFSRRQTDNRYFLGICLAIFGGLGWMIEHEFINTNFTLIVFACVLGLFICASWFATIRLYKGSLKSTYKVLRLIETKGLPLPLYSIDKDHKDRISCCKDFLKFFRHNVPILCFLCVYIGALIYSIVERVK